MALHSVMAHYVLLLQVVAFSAAERLHSREAGVFLDAQAVSGPSDPGAEVNKLRVMVDPDSQVCGNTEIKAIVKGDAEGKQHGQLFSMIQAIPWKKIERISGSFVETCADNINALTQKALQLQVSLDAKLKEEAWSEVDRGKVGSAFSDAIAHGFKDQKYGDPTKLAKLTHCGATRPPASTWDQDPKRRGTIKAPGGRHAADSTVAKFSELAAALYEEAAGGAEAVAVYIDTGALQEKCCLTFGLLPDCIQANLVDLNEKCDDICRGMDDWAQGRNSDQGFTRASHSDSSDAIKQQLAEITAEAEKNQREMNECKDAAAEINLFKKEIDEMLAGVHQLKQGYEACRDGLFDAEEEVDKTNDLLDSATERLAKLEAALSKGNDKTQKLVPLMERATAKVQKLRDIMATTKEELAFTNRTLRQLTAANNVIVELKEKVSALLIQMVATFGRVVGQRIQKVGFEAIDMAEALGDFPSDIRAVEEAEFQSLDSSIGNMTRYCADAERAATLRNIEDHADVAEFCAALEKFPAKEIGSQLQGAIQEHIDEFRSWLANTASGYQKFHGWLKPPAYELRGNFEPMGLRDSVAPFSRTEFFKLYLARWEHETGALYSAYHKMMDSFAERGNMQSELLMEAVQTEKQFVTEQGKLDQILGKMKKLAVKMHTTGAAKAEQTKLFDAYQQKLTELGAHAKEKEAVLESAKKKFDDSWSALVGFHQQKTSLTMLFEGLRPGAAGTAEGGGRRGGIADTP